MKGSEKLEKYVLVVDANDLLLRSLKRNSALNSIPGVEFDGVTNIEDARDKIQANVSRLAVVVTGNDVVAGTGEEVIRAAHEANPKVRIIYFTGAPKSVRDDVRKDLFAVLDKLEQRNELPIQVRRALMESVD